MSIFWFLFKSKDRYIKSLEEHIEQLEEARLVENECTIFGAFNPEWVKDSDWRWSYKCELFGIYGEVLFLTNVWNSKTPHTLRYSSYKEHKNESDAKLYVEKEFAEQIDKIIKIYRRRNEKLRQES